MRSSLIVSNPLGEPISARLSEVLRARVDAQGPETTDHDAAEHTAARLQAGMVAVLLTPDAEQGLETIRRLRRAITGHVLAVGDASDSKLILRALHDGADHYLDVSDLESGLEAVLTRLGSRQDAAPMGRLIAVLGASGGSGASTLAVNLATLLAKGHDRCALLDLKPGRGDLAALLDLRPAFHLADLCVNAARLDQAMLEKALVRHAASIHLLASPQVFGDTRLVTPQGVCQILTVTRRLFAHVVADLEDCFHEEQLLALRQAAAILLVSRLDFTSLRNSRRILEYLAERGVPRNRVRLVVNRRGQPSEMPLEDAEEALGSKITDCIPDDPRNVNAANNSGVPVVLRTPRAKYSQAVAQLAATAFERRRSNQPPAPQTSTVSRLAFWR